MFATRLLPCLAIAIVGFVGQAAPAADEAMTRELLHKEGLGGLHLDQAAKDVIKLFGKAEKEGKLVYQEADGNYVQTWSYPSKGIDLVMSAGGKKSAMTVASITAKAPCDLATTHGIKIGSPATATRQAYAYARAISEDPGEPDVLTVGTVYGGIIFDFKHGKVSRIFFGAAAE